MTKKTKIRHRNGINQTFTTMPLPARRVLFLIMAQIDPKHLIAEGRIFEITAKDYARLCDIDIDTAYNQLKMGAEQLHNQTLKIPQEELLKAFARRPGEIHESEKKWKGMRLLHITESCSYVDQEASVQVRFSRQIEPYICMLERDFTTQLLLSSVRLSDSNASNLYQYLRQKISSGKTSYFDIEVDKFRVDLGIDKLETYKAYKFLKNQFIDRSVKKILEITEFTKINVDIIERKGRKAHKLRFSYEYENV
ncbi:replication initiation protein [Providencia rettgeri]